MLLEWAGDGGLSPLDETCVNPASVDLKLDRYYVDLESGEDFEASTVLLKPGMAILATTLEYVKMPLYAAGVLYLKSTLARQGLDHALAGFVDCGFMGCLTMELHSHRPIMLEAGQRVVQLVLYEMCELPDKGYNGRYQGQTGPTRARAEQ